MRTSNTPKIEPRSAFIQTTRRTVLRAAAAVAAGAFVSPLLSLAQTPGGGKKILFFTRSQGFPHSVVTRKSPDELAFAEALFKEIATKAGYDVTVTKDGTMLAPDKLDQWDTFAFYTTGILTDPPGTQYKSDQTPAIPQEGKAALLKAIENGKGFIGFHCATDTFHSPKHDQMLRPADAPASVDPYIAMIGGEFGSHGSQQKSMIRVATKTFPGLSDLKDFEMTEEWYSLYNLDPKMHVILVQDTTTMGTNGNVQAQYRRDPYPATWAKLHGKGPVFYTSMGHREDVWTNPIFQKVLLSGLAFASGNAKAEVPSNLKEACPKLAATMTT